ncbi:MAG: hypothetical protein NVS2B12_18270 [Ktedonobacteraceae bacterium]
MEPDVAQLLQHVPREQLILLLQEIVKRHPTLAPEIETMLTTLATPATLSAFANRPADQSPPLDDEFTADALILRRPSPQQLPAPFHLDAYRQHMQDYALRMQQGATPQDILDDLVTLLQEAEWRADQYDYQQALTIYALVIDTRLALDNTILIYIFDRALNEFMPVLVTLLSEASSLITSDDDSDTSNATDEHPLPKIDVLPLSGDALPALSAVLPTEKRQLWLERLFSLWLKRLDSYYTEENLPGVMLEIAWSDDVPLLRSLVEKELQQQPASMHSNIVDFSLQSRTRTLEKFLRELPYS